jgi:hypothetical protein
MMVEVRNSAFRAEGGHLTAVLCIMLVLGTGYARGQDFYWEMRSADSTAAPARVSYSQGKLKYVSPREQDPVLIVRLDRKSVLVVNHRRESFAEVSFEEWRSMRGQQSNVVVQIPPEVDRLPEEQRARKVHELIDEQSKAGRAVDVVRVQEMKTVRGFVCAKFVVKVDGKVALSVWATRGVKEFPSMRGNLVGAYGQLALAYPAMKLYADALKNIDGFPMEYQWGDERSTVTQLQKRNWGEEEFEAPAGYRKTTAAVPQH